MSVPAGLSWRNFAVSDVKLAYSVRDFFLNGGSQALVVRLHKNATVAKNAALQVEAASAGKWGGKLT